MFPNPRNHNMRRVYCCDLMRYRWTERDVRGDPPNLSEARRNMDCFLDGKRLIVFGTLRCSATLTIYVYRYLQSQPCKRLIVFSK